MGIVFNQEIAHQMRLKLALDPFPTQERLNQMRDEAVRTYNIEYAAMHPELSLASQNNNPTTITQNQIERIISTMVPTSKPTTT